MTQRNVATWLSASTEKFPDRRAVIMDLGGRTKTSSPGGAQKTCSTWTFAELNGTVDALARGMRSYGLSKGDRALLMIRPGYEFIAVTFALLKLGVVPVFIDPGMGLKALKQCIQEVRPSAFIAVPIAFVFPLLFPGAFRSVGKKIVVGGSVAAAVTGGRCLAGLSCPAEESFAAAAVDTGDEAIIAFTSGSTGIPKGVVFTHPMLEALLGILRDEIGIREKEIDLPGLPIFALFNPALGVTTVIPDMDPSRAIKADPARLVKQILTHGVTTTFGSPTIWKKVAAHCLEHDIRLPGIKRILMAGAPVPHDLLKKFKTILSHGSVLTPYGATEAIALTAITGDEILREAEPGGYPDRGVCVGKPLGKNRLYIIAITDGPILAWNDATVLPPGEVGEIVARGPLVTHVYLNRPVETGHAKIYDGKDVLHRMGDLGYMDEKGRLWFCGRKSHRVVTPEGMMMTVPCEAVFNRHPAVARTALVGLGAKGSQLPLLVVEIKPGTKVHKRDVLSELLELGARHEHTKRIKHILFHPRFPVDVRHNAKIQREKLQDWAGTKLRGAVL